MKQAQSSEFWRVLAPYLSYCEDNFLDRHCIRKLMPLITSPVLVVGAGQGLLVDELQKNGHTVTGIDNQPLMIEYARKRRGLELTPADATALPFDDGQYKTAIVATGVVDFMEDANDIKSVIIEARRVTADSGAVLVAFYRFGAQKEQLMRRLGLITADGFWRYRLFLNMFRLRPGDLVRFVGRQTGNGPFKSFMTMLKAHLTSPTSHRATTRNLMLMYKQLRRNAEDIDQFVNSAPESVPFRNDTEITELFDSMGIPLRSTTNLDSCTVVRL